MQNVRASDGGMAVVGLAIVLGFLFVGAGLVALATWLLTGRDT